MLGDRINDIPVPEFFDGIKEPHSKILIESLQILNEQQTENWELMIAYMNKYFKRESELWFEVHRKDWESFEHFCEAFIDKFWSQEKQECLKSKIMTEKSYNGNLQLYHQVIELNTIFAHVHFCFCATCCKTVTGRIEIDIIGR